MRGMTLGLVVSACVGLGLSACNGGDATGGNVDVGRAQIALTNVPADGTCVQVVAAAYRTVTRNFQAPAGASSVFEMSGLPVGQVTFTASAFGGACPPAPGTVANWISDAAFTATIAVDPPALVTLNLVRNGNANVSIGFDDSADGGLAADGGASSGGGATGPSGGASTFMKVDSVMGPETAAPFMGWFDLESFQLGSATAHSAAGGGGAGAGKTTWSATATLLYQTGLPDLLSGEAAGKHFKTVEFAMLEGDPSTPIIWRATLTNVLISAITSGGHGSDARPEMTITFVFGAIKIEFDGGTNADGTPATATVATFDLTTNTGSAAPNPPVALQFVVGGPAPMNFEAVDSFHAPSEMTPVSAAGAGTGAGAGKTTFSDASIALPVDATVLDLLLEEVAGSVTRTALVEIDTTTPAAGAAEFGALNFANVLIDGVSFSGLEATVSFAASSFGWSVGADQTTSP